MSRLLLEGILNRARGFSPPLGLVSRWETDLLGLRPLTFPSGLLWSLSDFLAPRIKLDHENASSFDEYVQLLFEVFDRFTRVHGLMSTKRDLSDELKEILNNSKEYIKKAREAIDERKYELYAYLARWGIECLNELSNRIRDNVFILGAGPVGLVTAYFLVQAVPGIKIQLVDSRHEYTRRYHILLTEESYNLLPDQVRDQIWGDGKYGCFVLPPPGDRKGYCYLTPPIFDDLPDTAYAEWVNQEFFDTDQRDRRSLKKLMSVPVLIFEKVMKSFLDSRYRNINFWTPGQETGTLKIRLHPQSGKDGLNQMQIINDSGEVLKKEMFGQDAMYDYVINAAGVTGGIAAADAESEKVYGKASPTFYNDALGTDYGMTVLIKHDPHAAGTLQRFFHRDNVHMAAAQHESRFFTPARGYDQILLSMRLPPDEFALFDNQGAKEWDDLPGDIKKRVNRLYSGYLDKELDPALVTKIKVFEIKLGKADKMFDRVSGTREGDTYYTLRIGDSACAVHYFSGTGINNGIKMAIQLAKVFHQTYQSRWKSAPGNSLAEWAKKMDKQCDTVHKKSLPFIQTNLKK